MKPYKPSIFDIPAGKKRPRSRGSKGSSSPTPQKARIMEDEDKKPRLTVQPFPAMPDVTVAPGPSVWDSDRPVTRSYAKCRYSSGANGGAVEVTNQPEGIYSFKDLSWVPSNKKRASAAAAGKKIEIFDSDEDSGDEAGEHFIILSKYKPDLIVTIESDDECMPEGYIVCLSAFTDYFCF